MESKAFDVMADSADHHCWWEGRRRVLGSLIDRLRLPPGAQILDVGTGTGSNLPLLARYGSVHACEIDPGARRIAAARGLGLVEYGSLPTDLPFAGRSFDLITLLDVIEHIDDDVAALRAVAARLAPNGALLITVPALPSMWSKLDQDSHRRRRYLRSGLRARLSQAGLRADFIGYFLTLLFPAALIRREIAHWRPGTYDTDMLRMPHPMINRLLREIFALERFFVGRVPFPIGLSLLAIARAGDGTPARS
jgi:SAM-dependent methyltransferase